MAKNTPSAGKGWKNKPKTKKFHDGWERIWGGFSDERKKRIQKKIEEKVAVIEKDTRDIKHRMEMYRAHWEQLKKDRPDLFEGEE